ncbi:unnamed protein product [Owenia fusiformis]|uniref:Uncharacterized protein n=1 Tax=Owenia fusiformis TaxID=6347 RepID=A0A8J1TDB5_OWEFU|nr:unnamed protein product [Owenia fusiformis]
MIFLKFTSRSNCKRFLLGHSVPHILFVGVFIRQFMPCFASTMKAAQFTPGPPENINIGEVPIPTLRSSEVLLKVYTTAINRADTLQRKGLYPAPKDESNILGLEAAGTVEKLGPDVKTLNVGDRVMALLPGGGNAEYVAVRENHTIKVPSSMTWTKAGAIPEVWLTAYQLLHFVGHVKPGETVLLHAGGSGVGTAATQLCDLIGAKAIVTAGSEAKINMAKSLGAVAGFNYKEVDFAEKVLEFTEGKGVDLILDPVGGSYWEKNTAAIALDGRWVLYGSMGGGKVDGDILAKILRKRIQLTGSTLRTRSNQYKAELVKSFEEHTLEHFQSGKLKPIIDTVLPLSKLADAHALMESNKNNGKIVIVVRDDESDIKAEL